MHIVKLVVTVEFTPSAGLWCRLLREPRGPKWMPGSGPVVWSCLIRGSSLKLSRNFYGFLILSRIADLLHALAQSRVACMRDCEKQDVDLERLPSRCCRWGDSRPQTARVAFVTVDTHSC